MYAWKVFEMNEDSRKRQRLSKANKAQNLSCIVDARFNTCDFLAYAMNFDDFFCWSAICLSLKEIFVRIL